MATTFRAVGVSSAAGGARGSGKDRVPIFDCTVAFVEMSANPPSERTLFTKTVQAADLAELTAACETTLAVLLAKHEETYLALDITRRTLAEVTSPLPTGERAELTVKPAVKATDQKEGRRP